MKFFVIGDVSVDHLHFLEHIPAPGEESIPSRSVLLPGGAGGTAAYHLAKLGNDVRLAARVGDDPFKDVALKQLKSAKVNLGSLQEDETLLTGTITIMVMPDAERAMIAAGGANRNLDAAELKKKDVDAADAMLVSAYSLIGGPQREYAVKAIAAAKKAEIPVFIDLGTGAVNSAGPKLLESVKNADYLLMNQHELERITGITGISEALESLREHGLSNIVIKLGAMGAIVWTPKHTELLEAHEIEDVVDSTGAGDAFAAAFAHAVMSKMEMRQAVRYANVAGALAASSVGAQGASLNHEDILKKLKK